MLALPPPGGEQRMHRNRAVAALLAVIQSRAFLAVIESLAALAGCALLSGAIGLVLMLVLVPPTFEAELDLVPRRSEPAPLSEIASGIERTGLAVSVETVDDETGRRLLLTGLPTAELPHELLVLVLSESGYGIEDLSVRPAVDLHRVINKIGVPYLTLQALVFILAGGLLMRLRLDRRFEPRVPRPLASAGLGLLAGVGAFLASLLVGGVLKLLGLPVQEQGWVLELLQDRQGLLRLVPWLVLIVPVSEEVFFRGYMFRWLLERAGAPIGFAVSSIMFAVLHWNASGFFIYLGVGLIFAWVCRRTGGLLAPVTGHVVYNSIVMIVALQTPPPM